jgi:hypothetical protein
MSDRAMTLLVHGLSKAGKSTLAVTGPLPILLADAEASARFLLHLRQVRWDPMTEPEPPHWDGSWDVCVVSTRTWATVEKIYQRLLSGHLPFRTFVIDSISELQQRYIDETSGRQQPTLQGWGDIFRQIRGLLADIRDLTDIPGHPLEAIVMTAMTKQDGKTWRPFVQGQLITTMPYLFDIIGYLSVQQVMGLDGQPVEQRTLLTRRTADIEAGERVQGRIEPVVLDPRVDTMLDSIFGRVDALPREPIVPATNEELMPQVETVTIPEELR